MLTRRLLPIAMLPMVALPRTGGRAGTLAASGPGTRNCGDPGGSFIACEEVRETLPPVSGAGCPFCGGRHPAKGGT